MRQSLKRILFVVYELPPLGGGVATSAYYMLQEFANKKGWQIDVVTSSLTNRFEHSTLAPNINIYAVPIGIKPPTHYQRQKPLEMLRFLFNSARQIRILQKKQEYLITHFYGYPGAMIGWMQRSRYPYIVSLRGVDVPGYNQRFNWHYKLYKPLTLMTWNSAAAVTAPSQFLAKLAHQIVPELPIIVIPNSVDADLFHPITENQKYSIFTVTAGGTILGKKKGLSYLIDGFSAFHKKYPDTQLVLYGDGDELNSLHQQAQKLRLDSTIKFKGRVSPKVLASDLAKCHVFCLPSRAEGMSNALLEAQACELAIITTPVGGGIDLIQANAALAIKIGDSQSITDALEKLYSNKKLRLEIAKRSHRLLVASWKEVAAQYQNIYKQAI